MFESIKKWHFRNSLSERIFDVLNIIFLAIIGFVSLYPFWQIVAESINEPLDAMSGGIYFLPRKFSLIAYETVFNDDTLVSSFIVSILRTVIGTAVSLIVTSLLAYALSKPFLIGNKFLNIVCLITMFFNGGMIPTYIVISNLNLIDNFLVFILPSAVNVWNMIIMKSFFEAIPQSIEESAKLDGAGWYTIFFALVVPLSKSVIATVCLFFAVAQWSSWFDAYIYIFDAIELYPMQTILMRTIRQNATSGGDVTGSKTGGVITITSKSIELATIVISTLPIICIYPFVQKYFVQGILIGGVKE